MAKGHRDFVAQHQILLHLRAAQVNHAMRGAYVFRQIVIIQLEGGVTAVLSMPAHDKEFRFRRWADLNSRCRQDGGVLTP